MINIIEIGKSSFHLEQVPTIFPENEFSRKYYMLNQSNKKICKLSVSSEIKPNIMILGDSFGVGCDLSVAFFDGKLNKVIRQLSLSCFFYDFELSERYIFIVCEMEIIVLCKKNFKDFKKFEFIELIEQIEIDGNQLTVFFIDHSREDINL